MYLGAPGSHSERMEGKGVGSPRVSVIIPAFNRQVYLDQAIQSVLAQSFQDFELIVVDDHSPSPLVVPEDSRIILIRAPQNAGKSAAINRALTVASGDIVCFLDDDDTWGTRRLEHVDRAHRHFDVALCQDVVMGREDPSDEEHVQIDQFTSPSSWTRELPRHMNCISVKRAHCPEFDVRFRASQDVEWAIRLQGQEPTVGLIHSKDAVWRVHDGTRHGNSRRVRIQAGWDLLRLHEVHYQRHPAQHAFRLYRIGLMQTQEGNFGAAIRAGARSFRTKPSLWPFHLLRQALSAFIQPTASVVRVESRVLVTIVPSLEPLGGIARSSLEVARGLAQRGWKVHCIYQRSGALEDEWASFASMHRLNNLQFTLSQPLRNIRLLLRLVRLRLPAGAVVYGHSLPQFEFAWLLSVLRSGALALHLRGDPRSVSKRQLRALRAAQARIAVSDETRTHWLANFLTAKIEVVPNGVDTETLSRVRPRESVAADPLKVLYLGRIEPEKGFDIAVGGFTMASPCLPEGSRMRIVGGTRNHDHASWASHLMGGSQAAIEMDGSTPDVSIALSDTDIVLMPSRTEAFGRVAVEAMACGVPVIGSRVGGLERVLAGVASNSLIEVGSVEDVASSLLAASAARPLPAAQREALRRRARQYALTRTVEQIDDILTRLLR